MIEFKKISANWIYKKGRFKTLELPLENNQESFFLTSTVSVAVCTYQRAVSLKRFLLSLAKQLRTPDSLIIVDASYDVETEHIVQEYIHEQIDISYSILYLRVAGNLRGLTRQRNIALEFVATDLVAFFDDDIVLKPDCLKELESVITTKDDLVGAGAFILDEDSTPGLKWNSLYWLRAVTDLIPGKYHRSGLVIPLRLATGIHDNLLEVDRLSGCCMLWRTAAARNECFNDFFYGYSQSEDLEFSRRIAKYGRMVISGRAQVNHLHDPQGRPDQFQLGQMGIVNRYYIHRTTLNDRTWVDVLWFVYAQTLYILFTVISMFLYKKWGDGLQYLRGTLSGVSKIL